MRTWGGGPGTLIWMWAKRGGHGPRGEHLGGARQHAEHHQHARKDEPFNLYNSSPGSAHARGENSKLGHTIRPKVNGGLTTGASWAPRQFTRTRELLHGTLNPTLGAYVGLEGGARTWRLNTGPPMSSQKWTGATRQERAEPHGQFTGIDDFIACATSTVGTRGRHQGHQHAKTSMVLAWRYWTVCRSLRIDLSGPHQAVLSVRRAMCWRLFLLFNSGPMCLSLKIVIWIYMYDVSEVYVPSCSLWGRELGQQAHMLWLFSQDFLKGSRARRRYWCRNVAWLHLVWAGVYFPPSPPPPDLVVPHAPLLAYVSRGVGGVPFANTISNSQL